MRTDPATRVFGDVRINVVVAALVFLGAVAYLVKERRPREELPWHPRPRGGHAAVDPAAATEEMGVPANTDVAPADRPSEPEPAADPTTTDAAADGRPSGAYREPVPADAPAGRGAEAGAGTTAEAGAESGSQASGRAP